MKITKIPAWIAVFLAFACAREAADPCAPQAGERELRVCLPEQTRTFLGEASGGHRPVIWAEGDRISSGGVLSEPLAADEAGGSSAVFRFTGPLAAPYNVLSPASESADRIVLPASQKYVEGSYDPACVPMYGGGWDAADLRLSHFSAILEIPLTGATGKSIRRIMVLSSDGMPLCGTLVPGRDEEGIFDGSFSISGGASSVVLEASGAGVPLSSTPTSLFVAIPSGEYPGGFNFVVQSSDGEAMRMIYVPAESRLDAASLVRFPSKDFQADSDFMIISTEEDFLDFAASPSKSTSLIISDLDLTDRVIEPFSFSKTLDGGGHTIKGLSAPLFTTVSGTVKNLTIEGSFSVPSGSPVGFLASQLTGTLENITLKGSYSYSMSGELSSTTYVGGLAGRLTGGGVACGCTVEAEILIPSTIVMNADAHFGGLFGQVSSSTVEDCVFAGKMEVGPRSPGSYVSRGLNFGGIAGNLSGGRSSGNVNKGELLFTGSWLNSLRYGGVFGYVSGASTCTADRNSGIVTAAPLNTDTDKARYGGVGGVYGIVDNVNITIKDAVNTEEGVVAYRPESSPSYSFAVGGVVQSVYKDAAELSGLVNKGRIVVDGSEIATTSSRRGVFVGGIFGTNVGTNVHDCVFEGEIDAVPLSTVRNGFGGIVGHLGDSDPSVATSGAVSSCRMSSGAKIIISRKYSDKPVMAGGIVGFSRTCDGSITNCTASGTIESTGVLSASSERQYFGGIIGMVYSSGTQAFRIAGCSSEGEINLLSAGGSDRICTGGILGGASILNVALEDCSSSVRTKVEGNVQSPRFGGILGNLAGRSGGVGASVSNCHFSGEILLLEQKKLSDAPVAGGIVAFAGASSTETIVRLSISECSSSGNIRRKVLGISDVLASNKCSVSIAGGILGAAGLRQVWESEDVSGGEKVCSVNVDVVSDGCVEAEISDCTHSGLIFFNPNAGNEDPLGGSGTRIELSPNFTICGGIVGVSAPTLGILSLSGCRNEGSLFSTSGTQGGIVGWLHTRSRILHSDNSGLVYERDINMPVRTGSGTGYVIGGGIVGGVSTAAENSIVEYCWNSGDVAGSSFSAMPVPCAGGLVGSYTGSGIFVHCKNSGHVRNYPVSGSADLGGYFSGDVSDGGFSSCAAGGWVARGGSWAAADASWASRAYGDGSSASSLQNCTMWDNHSKLPWED